MNSNILELLNIPTISPKRHYWIIRTNGGDYYEDFVLHQYISIAWDYVSLTILNNETEESIKRLISVYEKSNDEDIDLDDEDTDGSAKGKITAVYNKIHKFVFEISKGDIVLIPSVNSDQITIAEVTGDVYETTNYVEMYLKENPETELNPCPYFKRRKIHTLKTISKSEMDIYLAKGFSSQHALSNMDDYAQFIDRTIYKIYSKGDEVHTTLHAGHPNGLTLKDLVDLSTYLDKAAASIAEQCEIPYNSSDIGVKLNIHSPGLVELIGCMAAGGVVISLLMFSLNNLINGGSLNLSFKRDGTTKDIDFSVNSTSPGLRGHNQEDKKIELTEKTELLNLINNLDIKTPEIVSAILNDEKITPEMISEAQTKAISSSESEDTV